MKVIHKFEVVLNEVNLFKKEIEKTIGKIEKIKQLASKEGNDNDVIGYCETIEKYLKDSIAYLSLAMENLWKVINNYEILNSSLDK